MRWWLVNIRLNSIHYLILKLPNRQEIQQIAFSHLSDTTFQLFINLCKKFIPKPYSFLVIATTVSSFRFRQNFLERIWKLIMAINDKITDEKVQYDINREAAKISHYRQVKLINMYTLRVKKHYLLDQVK